MQNLMLIRGIPGSGKSTLARRFCNAGFVHLEADMYFIKDGEYNFDATKLKYAHEWCQTSTVDELRKCRSVCVSNTFTTIKELKPYFDIAASFEIVPTVILAQNQFQNVHNVPDEAMTRMQGRFQYDISTLFESKE